MLELIYFAIFGAGFDFQRQKIAPLGRLIFSSTIVSQRESSSTRKWTVSITILDQLFELPLILVCPVEFAQQHDYSSKIGAEGLQSTDHVEVAA